MAVERSRVNVSAVVEVEDPAALMALARASLGDGVPPSELHMFLSDTASALGHVIDPESVTVGLPGVAFVTGSAGATVVEADEP
jgi:hypothetical protein